MVYLFENNDDDKAGECRWPWESAGGLAVTDESGLNSFMFVFIVYHFLSVGHVSRKSKPVLPEFISWKMNR